MRILVNNPQLTQKQKDIVTQLTTYDSRIKPAYLGAIYVLQQKEYPDRLVHFAHSLREVIDLLTRVNQTDIERKSSLKKN